MRSLATTEKRPSSRLRPDEFSSLLRIGLAVDPGRATVDSFQMGPDALWQRHDAPQCSAHYGHSKVFPKEDNFDVGYIQSSAEVGLTADSFQMSSAAP